jgi:hypothetical protein
MRLWRDLGKPLWILARPPKSRPTFLRGLSDSLSCRRSQPSALAGNDPGLLSRNDPGYRMTKLIRLRQTRDRTAQFGICRKWLLSGRSTAEKCDMRLRGDPENPLDEQQAQSKTRSPSQRDVDVAGGRKLTAIDKRPHKYANVPTIVPAACPLSNAGRVSDRSSAWLRRQSIPRRDCGRFGTASAQRIAAQPLRR